MSFRPSEYGFISVAPKTRAYRRSLRDKVSLERRLLSERVGLEARMHQKNAPETSAGLTSCVESGAGYLPNVERFHSDTSGEEQALRQHAADRRRQVDEFKRQQGLTREESRWQRMEEERRVEAEHWDQVRAAGAIGQKNKSKTAYNILSLDYTKSPEGKEQEYVDELVKYRAHLRSQNLTSKNKAAYNIISGEPLSDATADARRRPERRL